MRELGTWRLELETHNNGMPEKIFEVEIVTPEGVVLSQDAVSIVAPAVEGSLGVLADHAPLMAELTIGEIWIRDAEGEVTRLATSGGFMEVRKNTVRILADTAERAEERLRSRTTGIDHTRAEAALERALVRLRVARGE